MTAPPLDYFAREASDCLVRVQRWRDQGGPASAPVDVGADARAAARALRGAAAMAGEADLATLGAALERATTVASAGDGVLGAALDEALEAGARAVRAGRPLASHTAERVRAAAAGLGAAALALEVAPADAGSATPAGPPGAAIVPIRALAYDGDADFVVERAPAPPTTADRQFRDASRPLARALRRLVAEAHAASAEHGAPDAARARTLGSDLRAAVADVRELAESYDVAAAAEFFRRREPAAGALAPRTLAAVDAAAAGLLGEAIAAPDATPPRPTAVPREAVGTELATAEPTTAEPTTAEPTTAEPTTAEPTTAEPTTAEPATAEPAGAEPAGAEFRPATGEALVALLETGISGFGALGELGDGPVAAGVPPTVPASTGPDAVAVPNADSPAAGHSAAPLDSVSDSDPDGVVPIGTLLYRGPTAVARARAVRDTLRARPGPPDPALLDELYDLLDLVAAE